MEKGSQAGYIRPPVFSGYRGFYPSDPVELREMVEGYLEGAGGRQLAPPLSPPGTGGEREVATPGSGGERGNKPFGLISPHAGYVYSGPVAGYAYRQVKGFKYKTVIIIAPSHRDAFGFASIMPGGAYRTPLGDIPVDSATAELLVEAAGGAAQLSMIGHQSEPPYLAEHALEVQLPFLQVALGDFELVPIVLGGGDRRMAADLAEALLQIIRVKVAQDSVPAKSSGSDIRRDILLVASSDLSHYHSYDEAYRRDSRIIERIEAMDAEGIAVGCRNGSLEACGGIPIAIVTEAASRAGMQVRVLRHATSGDVPGGMKDQVVGYLAAMFDPKPSPPRFPGGTKGGHSKGIQSLNPSRKEAQLMIGIARDAIRSVVDPKPSPPRFPGGTKGGHSKGAVESSGQIESAAAAPDSPSLKQLRGLFVTLKRGGMLRGCIGRIIPDAPIEKLLPEVAVQSATQDPRFLPLSKPELDDLDVEITILGELSPISDPSELEIGVHGILLKGMGAQGVLLPQVAAEQGWDSLQFVEACCRKAGLYPDAWKKKDVDMFVFTADIVN